MRRLHVSKSKKSPSDIKEKARLYFEENCSLNEIAKQYNTYGKRIERELKAAGYQLRSKADAQRIRLAEGKVAHPTAGKELSDETKVKISNKMHDSWKSISEDERERRREVARDNFDKRTDKEEFIKQGFEHIKATSKDGSKLEKYIADRLNDAGYYTLVHQKHIVQDEKMHIDIMLPKNNIALEIDGPSHYSDIWGAESLSKTQARDSKKNGLLLGDGYHVIRLRAPSSVSDYFMRNSSDLILKQIESLADEVTPQISTIKLD